jgi:hypothetical protein
MTAAELIAELQKMPPDAQVIMQKDGEGNGFSPLDSLDADCIYVPDNTWSGEIIDTRWSASDACQSPEEWEETCKQKRCVLLYPVN